MLENEAAQGGGKGPTLAPSPGGFRAGSARDWVSLFLRLTYWELSEGRRRRHQRHLPADFARFFPLSPFLSFHWVSFCVPGLSPPIRCAISIIQLHVVAGARSSSIYSPSISNASGCLIFHLDIIISFFNSLCFQRISDETWQQHPEKWQLIRPLHHHILSF